MAALAVPAAAIRPTLGRRWRQAVEAASNRHFLTFEDGAGQTHDWTYGEWELVIARVAGHLRARGVGVGDRVHLALANSPAFLAAWFATSRIGAIMVPSDPRATAPELRAHIRMTEARVSVLGRAASGLPDMTVGAQSELIAVDEDDPTLDAWSDGTAVEIDDGFEYSHPAAIMFTSGTTSAPKGVVVTHGNYAFAGDTMAAAAKLTEHDRCLVVLPLFHANAQYYSVSAAVSAGAAVCLMSSFSATQFVEQVARHRATHASVFAAPMRMILARGARRVDGARLRHCWYAQNLQGDQLAEFAALVGCRPQQLYGMTETIPAVLSQRWSDPDPGGIGEPTVGCDVDIRVVDGADPAPAGAEGEITVGGEPGFHLFAGYWRAPEITAAAFLGGRFRTGDLGQVDPRGRFRFRGRRGDVLKVAGENVSTAEVEAVVDAHPSVHEVAVVGRPDPVRDEVPVAFVVRAPGRPEVTEEDLLAFAALSLSPSKRPREIHFVDELPRTSVGKIRKFMLPERPDPDPISG